MDPLIVNLKIEYKHLPIIFGILFVLFIIHLLVSKLRKKDFNFKQEIFNYSFIGIIAVIVLSIILIWYKPLPIKIQYYGLLFALAAVMGLFFLRYLFRIKGYNPKMVDEYMFYLLIGLIIGARLIHVIFYDPIYYLNNPGEILKIWEGGIASHGATIGTIVGTLIYVRKRDITFFQLADLVVIPMSLATMFIRLGNFFNSEIVGRIADVPWAVRFEKYQIPIDRVTREFSNIFYYYKKQISENTFLKSLVVQKIPESNLTNLLKSDNFQDKFMLNKTLSTLPRHPSQLYEMLIGLIVFIILFYMFKKKRDKLVDGVLFFSFFIAYFTLRFIVEFFKEFQTLTPDETFFTMGQFLSLGFIIVGIIMVYYLQKKKRLKPSPN